MGNILKAIAEDNGWDRNTPKWETPEERRECELAEMRSAIASLRAQVDQLKDELADAKKWAMQERAAKWHALSENDRIGREGRDE